MLSNIKSLIQEDMALKEAVNIVAEETEDNDLDDLIILGQESSIINDGDIYTEGMDVPESKLKDILYRSTRAVIRESGDGNKYSNKEKASNALNSVFSKFRKLYEGTRTPIERVDKVLGEVVPFVQKALDNKFATETVYDIDAEFDILIESNDDDEIIDVDSVFESDYDEELYEEGWTTNLKKPRKGWNPQRKAEYSDDKLMAANKRAAIKDQKAGLKSWEYHFFDKFTNPDWPEYKALQGRAYFLINHVATHDPERAIKDLNKSISNMNLSINDFKKFTKQHSFNDKDRKRVDACINSALKWRRLYQGLIDLIKKTAKLHKAGTYKYEVALESGYKELVKSKEFKDFRIRAESAEIDEENFITMYEAESDDEDNDDDVEFDTAIDTDNDKDDTDNSDDDSDGDAVDDDHDEEVDDEAEEELELDDGSSDDKEDKEDDDDSSDDIGDEEIDIDDDKEDKKDSENDEDEDDSDESEEELELDDEENDDSDSDVGDEEIDISDDEGDSDDDSDKDEDEVEIDVDTDEGKEEIDISSDGNTDIEVDDDDEGDVEITSTEVDADEDNVIKDDSTDDSSDDSDEDDDELNDEIEVDDTEEITPDATVDDVEVTVSPTQSIEDELLNSDGDDEDSLFTDVELDLSTNSIDDIEPSAPRSAMDAVAENYNSFNDYFENYINEAINLGGGNNNNNNDQNNDQNNQQDNDNNNGEDNVTTAVQDKVSDAADEAGEDLNTDGLDSNLSDLEDLGDGSDLGGDGSDDMDSDDLGGDEGDQSLDNTGNDGSGNVISDAMTAVGNLQIDFNKKIEDIRKNLLAAMQNGDM